MVKLTTSRQPPRPFLVNKHLRTAFTNLERTVFHSQPEEMTSSAPPAPISESILDALLPGSSFLSTIFVQWGGIDTSPYIALVASIIAIATLAKYFLAPILSLVTTYFCSTLVVRMEDEAYQYLMAWVAEQHFARTAHRIVASTEFGYNIGYRQEETDETSYNDSDEDIEGHEDLGDTGPQRLPSKPPSLFGAKARPMFWTPDTGSHFFHYRGRMLLFTRTPDERQTLFESTQRENVTVTCLGRNPSILKELMLEAQNGYLSRDKKKTIIYQATRRLGEPGMVWTRCMARHPRPLSTVIMPESQKSTIIIDMKKFLQSSTRLWYANRGIPYRRGYLFYGPPGTGKTSLAFVAAGLFQLRIYIVNLNSRSLTEDSLVEIFQSLPRNCIVLLEDIDATSNIRSGSTEPRNRRNSLGKGLKLRLAAYLYLDSLTSSTAWLRRKAGY